MVLQFLGKNEQERYASSYVQNRRHGCPPAKLAGELAGGRRLDYTLDDRVRQSQVISGLVSTAIQ